MNRLEFGISNRAALVPLERKRCNHKYHFQFWTNTLRKLWGGDPVVNTSYFIFDKYNFHFDKCIFHLEVVRVEFHSWESCNRHLVGGHPPWPPTREALTPQFGILSRTPGSLYNMNRIYEEMHKYKNIQIHKYIYHLAETVTLQFGILSGPGQEGP